MIRSVFTYGLLLSFSLLNANPLFQNEKEIDSLLKASLKDVYENPDRSIELSQNIYNDEDNSIKTRTKALMLISLAYTSKRDYQKALEYITKADEFSDQLDDHILNIEILYKTGIIYQQLKIFDKSIKFLDESEQLSLTYPIRDSVRRVLGSTYIVKGFIYKDNLNCDIALDFFDKGIKEYERLERTPQIENNMSIAYYNKGNCYTLLSEYENAKKSFNQSVKLAESQKANSLISFAQKGLAEVYTLEGDYETAVGLLNEALDKSSEVGDLVLYQGIYEGLFENYLALNQWEEYQKYYNLFLKTQLELKVSERNSISDSLDENHKNYSQSLEELYIKFTNGIEWIISIVIILLVILYLIFKRNISTNITLKKNIESLQNLKPKE